MKCYKVQEGAATFWVAAPNLLVAMQTMLKHYETVGTIEDFSTEDYVSFGEVPERKARELDIKMDDAEIPSRKLWDLSQECKEPEVIACSEWP